MEVDYQVPQFVIEENAKSFLLPAKDQSNFWKSRPNSVKNVNKKKIYYIVMVPVPKKTGKVRVDPKTFDKIDFSGTPEPFDHYDS